MYLGLVKAGVTLELACDPSAPEKQVLKEGGVLISELPVRSRLDMKAIRRLRTILKRTETGHHLHNNQQHPFVLTHRATGLDIQQVAYRGTIGHISRWDPAAG